MFAECELELQLGNVEGLAFKAMLPGLLVCAINNTALVPGVHTSETGPTGALDPEDAVNVIVTELGVQATFGPLLPGPKTTAPYDVASTTSNTAPTHL